MAYFRCGGGGIPSSLKTDMNAVYNKKFGTSTVYDPSVWASTANLMGPLPEKTIVSSPIADFSDGADDVPTRSLVVTIPASLSGVSSVTETQTGRNLVDDSKRFQASRTLVFNQTDNTSFSTYLKAGTYTISYSTTATNCYIYRREENDSANTNMGRSTSATFTLEEDGYFRFWLYGDDAVSENISDFQLEVGSTVHAYEPYTTPTQYTANLGRTIYGGTADIVNGTGTEVCGRIVYDGSNDENWAVYSSGNGYAIANSDMKSGTHYNNPLALCDEFNKVPDNTNLGIRIGVGNQNIYVVQANTITGVSDLATWRAWLAENPVTVVYPLATSEDFTFTGQEIPTRLGYNAFWSDEGDTEVTYRADISLLLGGN